MSQPCAKLLSIKGYTYKPRHSMESCRHVGRMLLWLVCGLMIYVFLFAHRYRLPTDTLSVKQATAIQAVVPTLFSKTFSTHIGFVTALNDAFQRYDTLLLNTYKLSKMQQAAWVSGVPDGPFTFTFAQITPPTYLDSALQLFHTQALHQHGAWLVGRNYDGQAAFAKDFAFVAQAVNTYAIQAEKSLFLSYERTQLQFTWLRAAAHGPLVDAPIATSSILFGMLLLGAFFYLLPRYRLDGTSGIKHNGLYQNAMSNRGWIGWFIGVLLIVFYIVLYFYPVYLAPWVMLVDPFSIGLKGSPAGPFFLYGLLYTLAISLMGLRMFIKYRHSVYHKVRTASLIFFQLIAAFLIPELLLRFNKPYFDFKNIWPLDYDFFFDTELSKLIEGGGLGLFMLGWGIALIVVAVPVLTYFFGKRWYCSWICGCGGLAETLGDPYRQLSDKSLRAWKIERWSIYSVLVIAIIMTVTVLYTYWSGKSHLLGVDSYTFRKAYGFYIGALFSGVIGTGFYPLMGSRVWCRFGCPLAAYLGLIQRFRSRFRITTNGGQCISCGNCSTYCEMGIDVRHYAQRGQPVIRASCVGCGVCASVCPRGVLRLENSSSNRGAENLLGLANVSAITKK